MCKLNGTNKMAMKEWVRQFQPMQLYVVLILSVIFFIAELTLSHITHALTLLLDSYQTLCNIMALTGCLVTLKHGKNVATKEEVKYSPNRKNNECFGEEQSSSFDEGQSPTAAVQENKLKNTFGWARIDVMTMLMCCVFLASLIFSLLVEAIQTLVHIDHSDEMHQPVLVFATGCLGLVLNGICYVLIGGFTFHQGSFLYVTESGDVVLDKVVTNNSIINGERRLSRTRTVPTPHYRQRQGCREIIRDCTGCVFVILCSILIYFTEKEVAKFIDPILSIFSAIIVLLFSYPYMKESCLILLQTIPASINIDILKKDLLEHFPDIVNVHDFHVWQLTASKVISTVHIIFQNPKVYANIINEIKQFFTDYGITQVTVQPEFRVRNFNPSDETSCLMQCQSEGCRPCHCCPNEVEINNLINRAKSISKEIVLDDTDIHLTALKIDNKEFCSTISAAQDKSIGPIKYSNHVQEDSQPDVQCETSFEESGTIEENELIEKL